MTQNSSITSKADICCRRAFTFVEVVAAIGLLSVMIASVLVIMNQYVGAVTDMRLRQEAFELARSNMEGLLSESRLPDIYDYGESETNPAVDWQTIVEPFNEPYNGRMWIRAVCSASFLNSKDEEETVELEHWITNLTSAQIKQILAQQEMEEAYLDLLEEGQYTDIQLTTIAFLEQEGLGAESYKDLLEEQRREKVNYLNKNGVEGYDEFLEQLGDEENTFLERLGMDFDKYNEFAENYTPETDSGTGESKPDSQPIDSIPGLENLPDDAKELLGL